MADYLARDRSGAHDQLMLALRKLEKQTRSHGRLNVRAKKPPGRDLECCAGVTGKSVRGYMGPGSILYQL